MVKLLPHEHGDRPSCSQRCLSYAQRDLSRQRQLDSPTYRENGRQHVIQVRLQLVAAVPFFCKDETICILTDGQERVNIK